VQINTQGDMMKFAIDDFETLYICPWCYSGNKHKWCDSIGFLSYAKCEDCGMVYADRRLNDKANLAYYKDYYSLVHNVQDLKKRNLMYKIESDFIKKFFTGGNVLDIGCSDGSFLKFFAGCNRYGIEFGEQAVSKAKGNISKIFYGDFTDINFEIKFDLIIFRGVIEHIRNPKIYLEKSISLLKDCGKIFITSTPNRNSICAQLFKEFWNQNNLGHIFHFSSNDLKTFFKEHGLELVAEKYFYRETPYYSDGDIGTIKRAIEYLKNGKEINFQSPAYWENLMSLVFEK
jgi:2-polyprenyl-3-methyl-5-hydroxy-6-metoxy-1,4-benzoquinol methylase